MSDRPIKLVTRPHQVYKVSDPGHVDSESWCFCVLIQADSDENLQVRSAQLELKSDSEVVKAINYRQASLNAIKGIRFRATSEDPPTSYKHFAD